MPRTDAVLDALALAEAALCKDGEALAILLDHTDPRAVCLALADMVAGCLGDGDPAAVREILAELQRLRPVLVAAGDSPDAA
jgi:hypothetical protein